MCVVDSLVQGATILSLVRVGFTEEEVRLGCGGAEPKRWSSQTVLFMRFYFTSVPFSFSAYP